MKRIKKLFKTTNVLFVLLFVILLLYSVSMILPALWGIFTSFKSQDEFMRRAWQLPQHWDFTNYLTAIDKFRVVVTKSDMQLSYNIFSMLLNSVIYSLGCTVFATMTCCAVAYVVAKYDFKFLKWTHSLVIIVMVLPILGNLPSSLQVAKAVGTYDNMLGSFIMRISFTNLYFFIFYSVFKSLSWEYAEAARVDGAGNFTIMCRIMIPLVAPTVFAVMLMNFIECWNDYNTPMIFLPTTPTAAYGLYLYRFSFGQGTSSITMQITGCMLVMIPIFIVYLLLQKKLTGNLTVGGLKG